METTALGKVSATILKIVVDVGFDPSKMLLFGSVLTESGLAGLVGYRRRKKIRMTIPGIALKKAKR